MSRKQKNQDLTVGRDQALLQLCGAIFRNPEILVQAHWRCLKQKIYVAPHSHSELLQLDLMVGMAGVITMGKKEIPISGVTSFAFYPRQRHAIEMAPEAAQGEFYSIKIQVSPEWQAMKAAIFPSHLKLSVADHYLVKALRQLCQMSLMGNAHSSMLCATLSEVLSYWPASSLGFDFSVPKEPSEEIGVGMRNALDLIYKRLSDPPSVQELASVSSMSSRNFLRRFRDLFYCSPHIYITRHRLARAKEFLAHKNHRITEIAEELGFPSIHAFSRWFQRAEGVSPSVYKEKHFLL